MISWSLVCKELTDRGYKAEKKNLNLDSDEKSDVIKGILIETGDVNKSVVFNVSLLLEEVDDLENAVDYIVGFLEDVRLPVDVDYSKYLTKDHLLANVKLSLEERYWVPYLTKDSIFKDIQESCYISDVYHNMWWKVDIREDHIKELGITVDDLWSAAEKNTFKSFEYIQKPVRDIIGKSAESMVDSSPVKYMYSISNRDGIMGAVQVLNPMVQGLFKEYLVTKLVVYVQSENNVIIAPYKDGVLGMMKNIAEYDTAYTALSTNLYIIKPDMKVDLVIPFKQKG